MSTAVAVSTLADAYPTSGGQLWFLLKKYLKAQGWLVRKSGDGLSAYSSSGDTITGGSSGAHGMNNAKAWFVIEQPDLGRQICIQRGTGSHQDARIKYSYSAGFTGGSPAADTFATASDEQYIIGSSSTYVDATGGLNGTYPWYCGVQTDAPWGFWSAAWDATTSYGAFHAFVMDPMMEGSFPSQDVDPYVFYADATYGGGFNSSYSTKQMANTANGYPPKCWYKKGLTGAAWVSMQIHYTDYSSGATARSVLPRLLGNNPYNGDLDIVPMYYGRSTVDSQPGFKGFSSLMRWTGSVYEDGTVLDTQIGNKRWLYMNFCALRWDGSSGSVPAISGSAVITANEFGAASNIGNDTPDNPLPTISNFVPDVGTSIESDATLQFDVTDDSGDFTLTLLTVEYPTGATEVIYDGGAFASPYSGTKTNISGGFRFTCNCATGWRATPTIRAYAVDTLGAEAL